MESTYPEKFDSSNLSSEQKEILSDFFIKRKIFDSYLKEKGIELFTCPGCSYPTLLERGGYEICQICNWEDDDQDDPKADEIWEGPNGDLSLTENRLIIGSRLKNIAGKVNGKIIHNAGAVLFILQRHHDQIRKKPGDIDENVATHHLTFSQYLETEEILLGQLITRDNITV